MPFIVSKSRLLESTTALAFTTFEEARDHLIDYCEDRREPMGQTIYACIEGLNEDGDRITLPDGYVIKVYKATYAELRYYAGLGGVELYGLRDERRQQILDAYNSRDTSA